MGLDAVSPKVELTAPWPRAFDSKPRFLQLLWLGHFLRMRRLDNVLLLVLTTSVAIDVSVV